MALLAVVQLGVIGCGKTAGEPEDGPSNSADTGVPTVTLQIKGEAFELELATDDESRFQGLSDRKELAENGGMLFVFAEPTRTSFVMRRCYVPIDLIFLYEDGRIDQLHRMDVIEPVEGARWRSPTGSYPSSGRILYAIELPGGTLDRLGLERDEIIELPQEVLQLEAE